MQGTAGPTARKPRMLSLFTAGAVLGISEGYS